MITQFLTHVDDQRLHELAGEWVMPIQGEMLQLPQVPDPVFANGMMGEGFAINPTGGMVVSPVAGTVTLLLPTFNAIGVTAYNGAEILIHVGIDSAKLQGQGFAPQVNVGDQVMAGTPLLAVDWAFVGAHVSSLICPIVFKQAGMV
ncbi:MAG: hypothetical protein CR974_02455 [Gammaproteobacteria bacterium]|nr:MAG: hypothetical protein CR974_02455 [Gammaproteobacteria bacterium]